MKQAYPDRRTWLGLNSCVALGGITSIFRFENISAAENIESLRFYLVSDTHLGRQDSPAPGKNWIKTLKEISADDYSGKFILHLGDIVDRGRKEQYPVYSESRGLLDGLPIYEIPGNHDPVDLFQKYVSAQTDRSFDSNGIRFVIFNNSRQDSHDGFINPQQLKWLAEQFAGAEAANLAIVVACHVPIHKNQHPDRGWYVKLESGQLEFYQLLDQFADRVLACFHGHFHNGIRGWRDRGRTVETLIPSVCYNQNRNLQEHIALGKADGFFVEELRPGYVLAEISKTALTLTYKPLDGEVSGKYSAEYL